MASATATSVSGSVFGGLQRKAGKAKAHRARGGRPPGRHSGHTINERSKQIIG